MTKLLTSPRKIIILSSLIFILFLASILRLYKLDQVPPSLNWDEVAAGYNAFTIANWGKDEWGQSFPLVFSSFRDDKHPVHIYTAAIFIKLFGLNDFVTRFPGALFGVLNVLLIFFLGKILFKNNLAALFAAFLLAISPYNIQFSRGLWETNFALFYFMLGLFLFYKGLEKKNWWLSISFIAFILSIMSYHSSKVVVPVVLIVLLALYFKQLLKLKEKFYVGFFVFILFIIFLVLNPRLLGLARANQTKFSDDEIKQTQLFQKTHNPLLGLGEITFNQYLKHFSIDYLYKAGDQSPRNSIYVLGEFYKFEAPFLMLGLILLAYKRSKISVVLFTWLLIAPLPSAIVQGAPNATRALFMLGVFQLIEGYAIAKLLGFIKIRNLKYGVIIIITAIAFFSLKQYSDYYFNVYPKKDAIDWQYGMKEIVDFAQKNPYYSRYYITTVRSQPYIFFLYYLKYPLPKFLATVQYNQDEYKSSNTVYSFDKYQFGAWDQSYSMPDPGLVYVVEDSKFGGLAHLNDFQRIEKIKFPNGNNAFFIVSRY